MKYLAHKILINSKYHGYQKGLASVVYKVFHRKTESRVHANEVLAEELHKTLTEEFKIRKVYSRSKGNIWAEDLAEMES